MCTSRPSPPPAPPAPEPVSPPPITQNTQGAPRPAGYSEADGRNRNDATQADRRRVGSSVLRIPILGGL